MIGTQFRGIMNLNNTGIEEDLDICGVCHDLLCDARCERQVPSQLIIAGLSGLGILLLALLIRSWA